MEDNKKKIILNFNCEKKELNKIPESFEELKKCFFETFHINPSDNFQFLFIDKDGDKLRIDEKKEEFIKQITEIADYDNPEIIGEQDNLLSNDETPNSIDFFLLGKVDESENFDNNNEQNKEFDNKEQKN